MCQRSPRMDRPGKADEIGDVMTIDHLRAGYDALYHAAAEHERKGTFGSRTPHADAPERRVLQQHFLVEKSKATSGLRFRAKHFNSFAAARSIRQRHRDEDAIAIPYKSLRFDDGLGVSRRRDIDVGDFLVLQRLRDKLGRVGAEFQFDLPARRVAAGRDPIVFPHYRAYEQNSTDRYTVALGIHIWETG